MWWTMGAMAKLVWPCHVFPKFAGMSTLAWTWHPTFRNSSMRGIAMPARLVLLSAAWGLSVFWAHPAWTADKPKVVIPFDFVSKFDHGRYGEMVGEEIWKKLQREPGFITPESLSDIRDTCTQNNVHPTPEMPLGQVGKIVVQDFDAQIGIWGSIERVAGHDEDVYDLVIKCVDFSVPKQPKTIYQCNARTRSVSEIPHLYVRQMMDALTGRSPAGPPVVDPLAEENWKKNPNLVIGGDFQSGSNGVPRGWESVAGQQREPLGKLVRWVEEAGNPQNKLIRFTFDEEVGNNEGVMYYSLPFRVEEGAKYRFQCRWRTNGPAAKVFIKCYAELDTPYHSESATAASGSAAGKDHPPPVDRLREVYRSQQNLKGPKNTWNTQTEDFTPRQSNYTPRWGRVMLYGYVGAGVVEFDDVVVKLIVQGSASISVTKKRRTSLETKTTVEEMEENERRSKE
jgi:hypothetical protein